MRRLAARQSVGAVQIELRAGKQLLERDLAGDAACRGAFALGRVRTERDVFGLFLHGRRHGLLLGGAALADVRAGFESLTVPLQLDDFAAHLAISQFHGSPYNEVP